MIIHHHEAMQYAVRLSYEKMLDGAGGPFGAIVVLDNKIIGVGWNQVTSSNDPTAHAEIVAIREACQHTFSFHLKSAILYTSCEPCPMCLAAAFWARIDKIYYANTRQDAAEIGFDDKLFYEEISKPLHLHQVSMEQVGREEAIKVFEAWMKKTDKIDY
ncbi:MAG: nucleoside deaminase [Alphaproteobacteria bacterium]|nr:nucleoside deaminase [Alphaproteobacteria bacterium]